MISPTNRLRQSCDQHKLVWGNLRIAVLVAFSQTLFLCSHGYVVPPTQLSVPTSSHSSSSSSSSAAAFLTKKAVALSVSTSASADFDAFADSLEIDDSQAESASAATTSTKERPSSSSKTAQFLRNEARNNNGNNKPWQAKLEELLGSMPS